MSFGHVQLVKWSFPTVALIIGLLWYKRRRADRVDPGGQPKLKADVNGSTTKLNGNLCDSGIHTDDSSSLNTTATTPVKEIISLRKVSESLDIPNRRSSSQLLSCNSVELDNTPWYNDVENTPGIKEVQLGSNPANSGFDYMPKSRSAEQIKSNSKNSSIMENVIEEEVVAKVVVANIEVHQADFKNCDDKPMIESPSGDDKKKLALSERDSANHSPVSGVLDGSVNDEARSEGSTDSGKGGSINGHSKDNSRTMHEFSISTKLVGKLIGKGGKFLTQIRKKAEVSIVVKHHPLDPELNICRIDGAPDNIVLALELIRRNFPEKAYPNLTLEQINYEELIPEEITWIPDLVQLRLIEGVNNDVVITLIDKPNHFFVHMPTHPTYPSLRILDERLTQLYDNVESPPVPDELTKGMIVVAKWLDRWVRISIESPDPNGEQTLARMVDHGGFWTFNNANMRKIRSDFLTLPFQAIEVFLANIRPKDDEWSQEAYDVVMRICSSVVGQAQIVGYVDCNTFINLYYNIHKHGVISLADELIARGLAEPVSFEEIVPQEELLLTA
ncbi:KH domain-containing protein akap-1 [Phymastichus coffea]|uniref:KH domain-containing protein akap-1 n=1 Tax=Phymastichus coffea TaxID=108790 RepID=UPI00273BD1F9|nr:KH domain-containing protein akap-1 [Phymastichus coffea]XP_058806787.1 KH domain-containing protein akap-1 [Phymastichus coffea]XP_058806788.1 KH domain-containing protein akap-1 [Phymastichus coffea]